MRRLAVLFALLVPAAGWADPTPIGGTAAGYDPNQTICRNVRETGSRLNVNRVCMTRAQWDEHNRRTRQDVTHAQTTRVLPAQ